MPPANRSSLLFCLFLAACGGGSSNQVAQTSKQSSLLQSFVNPSGSHRTVSSTGNLSEDNPFFKSLGTNGRACVTCHQAALGWTITPAFVQERFDATGGADPLFRTVDGSNSPNADVSTLDARRKAYSMLLGKGLIRVGLPVPANAEFTLEAVDDPYGFANAKELSLFRRPLPSTNVKFLTTVMWDGRESTPNQSLREHLFNQANDATRGHAQAARDLTPEERNQILDFQLSMSTAQAFDNGVGATDGDGATAGPKSLAAQEFFVGINDPLGFNPTGAAFDPKAFHLFDAWANLSGSDATSEARRAVARGQALFNTKPINIVGVKGLNDELGVTSIPGTCTVCHDSPNVGHHSVPAPLDLGITDESRRTSDMPLYRLRCSATGELVKTTDPGRALVTGKCKDIGRFKGPILRGLATRAPYFHNGFAADLNAVVEFYETRFGIGLSDAEKADLVAFLKAL